MPRKRAQVRVNQFIGGFVSEANPLNFPQNVTVDEQNMEIKEDGSRQRRLGFDVEDNYSTVDTGIPIQIDGELGRSQFRWVNAGNTPDKKLLVVQIGNYLGIHDLDTFPLSGSLIYSTTFDAKTYSTTYSYAAIDGILVVATGERKFTVLEYDGTTVTSSQKTLRIRDLFGVEATDQQGRLLTSTRYMSFRPTTITSAHLYNLRNQTYALQRMTGQGDALTEIDPASSMKAVGNRWPSNSDNANLSLVANPNFTSDRTVERYNPISALATKPGTSFAPRGYFIIDALERGRSRLSRAARLKIENTSLTRTVHNLPSDTTPGGATVLAQYAGRVWYAGFSGEVISGDGRSPKMTSYVLFSQVVNDPTQINRCYQHADPTSNIDPDLVATDGGFIKVDGAYNIKALKAVETSLFVFAENGVWEISGLDRNSFTATNFRVSKVSSEGTVSGNSVVSTGERIFYWSQESINVVSRNEFGDWIVEDITETTIRTYYSSSGLSDKQSVVGYHDPSLSTIRWIFKNNITGKSVTEELVLNLKYPSFTKNLINASADLQGPISVSGGESVNATVSVIVTAAGIPVTVNGENVTVNEFVEQINANRSFYCILLDTSPTITYTFGGYIRTNWLDWSSFTGVDTPAYLITGPQTAGEAKLEKNIPYVTVFTNYTDQISGVDTSSCLISSQWNWTDSRAAGKWSTPRQAYRPSRHSDGETLVKTRNRLRGSGNAVSIRFESEAGKDLRVYGYEHSLDADEDE